MCSHPSVALRIKKLTVNFPQAALASEKTPGIKIPRAAASEECPNLIRAASNNDSREIKLNKKGFTQFFTSIFEHISRSKL